MPDCLRKLQKLQNRAARVLTFSKYDANVDYSNSSTSLAANSKSYDGVQVSTRVGSMEKSSLLDNLKFNQASTPRHDIRGKQLFIVTILPRTVFCTFAIM